MRAYECLYIVHPAADSSELEQSAAKFGEIVTGQGGTVRQVDQWGKRQLAYPIQKFTDGNYILMRFDAPATTIAELEFRMRVDDRVLRYMTSYEVPEGAGQNDELMQLTERKERDRRGRGRGPRGRGPRPGGGRGPREDGPRPPRDDQDDHAPRSARGADADRDNDGGRDD
ncbi:MAG: 30S ribosomal protein S6 [Candidatus Krumholzibacteriia bacterium]|nr:30S ribosomal protein S6 [bacterium]MCB9514835.1 30S ribosomal protein S6 [Candidatus Latescibacterota bacterium]